MLPPLDASLERCVNTAAAGCVASSGNKAQYEWWQKRLEFWRSQLPPKPAVKSTPLTTYALPLHYGDSRYFYSRVRAARARHS